MFTLEGILQTANWSVTSIDTPGTTVTVKEPLSSIQPSILSNTYV